MEIRHTDPVDVLRKRGVSPSCCGPELKSTFRRRRGLPGDSVFGAGMTLGGYDQAQEVLLEADAWFLPKQFRIGAKSESEQRVIHL